MNADWKEIFGGEGAPEYNALYNAIRFCGHDYTGNQDEYAHYAFLQDMPITSLTVELIDKLHEMGYKIVKINDSAPLRS